MSDSRFLQQFVRLPYRREQEVVGADSDPEQMELLIDSCWISQYTVVVLARIGYRYRRAESPQIRKLIQMIESDPERLRTSHGQACQCPMITVGNSSEMAIDK